jgi:transcriptional regulator
LLGAISGIEIVVERIEAKYKLNQNHPPANRAGVIAGLRRRGEPGDTALADLMTSHV